MEKSLQGVAAEGARRCPECGSTDLVKRDNEIYCNKCGLCIE